MAETRRHQQMRRDRAMSAWLAEIAKNPDAQRAWDNRSDDLDETVKAMEVYGLMTWMVSDPDDVPNSGDEQLHACCLVPNCAPFCIGCGPRPGWPAH